MSRWPGTGDDDEDRTPTSVRRIRDAVDRGRPSMTPVEAGFHESARAVRRAGWGTAFKVLGAIAIPGAVLFLYLGSFRERADTDHRSLGEVQQVQKATGETLVRTGNILVRIESKLGELDRGMDEIKKGQREAAQEVSELRREIERRRR